MTPRARIALLLAAAAVAVAAFVVVGTGGDEKGGGPSATAPGDATTTAATAPARPRRRAAPTVRLRGGRPVGGVARIVVEQGERLRFRVVSDERHEVHLHGFDVLREAAPGRPAAFDVPASFAGRFEVELEGTHEQIALVEVRP